MISDKDTDWPLPQDTQTVPSFSHIERRQTSSLRLANMYRMDVTALVFFKP